MMDIKETAKQIRQVLSQLLEGGYAMPIILTSIDRYRSLMVAEYTPAPGKKDHWDCAMLAERMKSSKARTGAQGALCCRLIYR